MQCGKGIPQQKATQGDRRLPCLCCLPHKLTGDHHELHTQLPKCSIQAERVLGDDALRPCGMAGKMPENWFCGCSNLPTEILHCRTASNIKSMEGCVTMQTGCGIWVHTAGGGRQPEQQRALRAIERGGWVKAGGRGLLLYMHKFVDVIMHARPVQVWGGEG